MRHWRWVLALASAPLAVFCLAALDVRWWAWLGINHLQSYFLDLVAVLAAGRARVLGLDVYGRNPFDPFGRPHVYGPWWLLAGRLGLDVNDAWWLGAVLGVAFVFIAALVLVPSNRKTLAFAGALLASPPILLGLERGNNDLVIFMLIAVGSYGLARRSERAASAGAGLIVVAAALKMYPIVAFAALGQRSRTRSAMVLFVGSVAAMAAIAWYWRSDYRQALSLAPQPRSMLAYGISITVLTWQTLVATRIWLAVGAMFALAAFAVPLFTLRHQLWRQIPDHGASAIAFVAAGLSWVACYAVVSNYGYRLILILFPAAYWLQQLAVAESGRAARFQLAGWIVVFWMPVVKRYYAMAALSDITPAAPASLSVFLGFEQMLVLVLTTALAFQILGALVRRLRIGASLAT